MRNLDLPENLPIPIDDGQCSHLTVGTKFPIEILKNLQTTSGRPVDIDSQPRTIIYFYPRTGVPSQKLPDGWNEIPGARGCTPESCAFRDHYEELKQLGANVYGCSTQTTEYQQEAAQRLHLPFDLLSDCKFELMNNLQLPNFSLAELENLPLIKRLTIVIRNDQIEKVFYPIFPPDQHSKEIIDWLKSNPIS